jgi:hypothetical protein
LALLCAFLSTVIFLAPKAVAQTDVSGNVSGVWTPAGSPYVAQDTVVVAAGESLLIEAGVRVVFTGPFTTSAVAGRRAFTSAYARRSFDDPIAATLIAGACPVSSTAISSGTALTSSMAPLPAFDAGAGAGER